MVHTKRVVASIPTEQYHIRRLIGTGSTRYLSVGSIVPKGWEAVKVFVVERGEKECIIKLIVIR